MARDSYALYRYFDDADRLLYVGISGALEVREAAHISRSRWMELAARSTIQRYATEADVLDAEETAIKAERPLFNVTHNDTPEARERLRAFLAEIGRIDLLRPARNSLPSATDGEMPGWPQVANVTRVGAGPFTFAVRHAPTMALEISADRFWVAIPINDPVAFDLSEALQKHAWEAAFGRYGLASPPPLGESVDADAVKLFDKAFDKAFDPPA